MACYGFTAISYCPLTAVPGAFFYLIHPNLTLSKWRVDAFSAGVYPSVNENLTLEDAMLSTLDAAPRQESLNLLVFKPTLRGMKTPTTVAVTEAHAPAENIWNRSL